MKKILILVMGLILAAWVHAQAVLLKNPPRAYICSFTHDSLTIDGRDDEPAWKSVPWSEAFTDIEGPTAPPPLFTTRTKMLWDNDNLYILAWLEEPHLWATLTQNESVIYHDNDFEVFIDPDWDTHHYYELEINALGTTWDLMLTRPYSLGGRAISAWSFDGLRKGIHLAGTLNQPSDVDTGWMVELAIPFRVLAEGAPNHSGPRPGDVWRINFSRVQWQLQIFNNQYFKKTDPGSGKPLPEYNWVWSPQYQVNMHKPEYWGFLLFSGNVAETDEVFTPPCDHEIYFALRQLFDEQYEFYHKHENFAKRLDLLPSGKKLARKYNIGLIAMKTAFYMWAPSTCDNQWLIIREDGSIRRSQKAFIPVL
ncbi:MAG: carbohydrate-binding family 9-like protein [Bacteroidales bacterium]